MGFLRTKEHLCGGPKYPHGPTSAQQVLDDHLNLSEIWEGEGARGATLKEDLRRNYSKDIVVLINSTNYQGTFRGHEGIRRLDEVLGVELPEHHLFEYTYTAAEGRIAYIEWAYEDHRVRVRDGVDSYLIEEGKIVGQTIHTRWSRNRARSVRQSAASLPKFREHPLSATQ